MSESSTGPTHDPIEALENFGTGGVPVNPLDPAAVRRLGDQRRRRQNTMYGAIAAVAVAAAVIPTAILATRDDGAKPPPITHTPPPTPAPTSTPTVVTFPEEGVSVKSKADLDKLVGTSDDFKTFIGTVLESDGASCPQPEINVMKYSSDGYARGAVGGCGGNQAIWVVQNGRWTEALDTQDEWRCGDLNRFGVPESFAGGCYGSPVLFGPDSVAGFSIGMTTEQVRAAGGVIQGDPAGDCAAVTKPGVIAPKGAPLHEVEMTFGKVIAMWAGKDVLTPQGIELGSTEAEVKKAYPDGHYDLHHYWHVAINDGSEYEIGVDGGNDPATVRELLIQTTGSQRCYG